MPTELHTCPDCGWQVIETDRKSHPERCDREAKRVADAICDSLPSEITTERHGYGSNRLALGVPNGTGGERTILLELDGGRIGIYELYGFDDLLVYETKALVLALAQIGR